jgi:hypothetical protein
VFLDPHAVRICEPKKRYIQKSTKKIPFEENLCYLAIKKAIRPQKGELLWDIPPDGSL